MVHEKGKRGNDIIIVNAKVSTVLKVETILKRPPRLVIDARCLEITGKVSFNIASEASNVYFLSGHKLIKNAKKGQFWRVFENLKLSVKQCYQTGQF